MILKLITATALVIATATTASAGIEATTEVPEWMTTQCPTEDSTNCHWDGGTHRPQQGEMFVREFPGRAHLTCYIFINRPHKDYCIKNHR